MGLRITDGTTSVAYLSDHAPQDLGTGEDGTGALHEAALELTAVRRPLDPRRPVHEARASCAGHFGHAAAEYAVKLAEVAGARRVMLFDHDPDRNGRGGRRDGTSGRCRGYGRGRRRSRRHERGTRCDRAGCLWRVGRLDSGCERERVGGMWSMGRKGRGAVVAAGMIAAAAVLVGASPNATAQQAPPVLVGRGPAAPAPLRSRRHRDLGGGRRCRRDADAEQLPLQGVHERSPVVDVHAVGRRRGAREQRPRRANEEQLQHRRGPRQRRGVVDRSPSVRRSRWTRGSRRPPSTSRASSTRRWTTRSAAIPPTITPISLSNASDNGPDAGPGDNDRVTITATRSGRSRSTPAAGEFSLEGGGDYAATTGPADTILTLATVFDRGVDCVESSRGSRRWQSDAASEATFDARARTTAPLIRPVLGHSGHVSRSWMTSRPIGQDDHAASTTRDAVRIEGTPQAVDSTLKIVWAPRAR